MIAEAISMLEAKINEVQAKIFKAATPTKIVTHRTDLQLENANPRLAELNAQIAQVHRIGNRYKVKMNTLRKRLSDIE